MKKLLTAICFLLFTFANAQTGIDNLWIMGLFGNPPDGTETINFITGTPVVNSINSPIGFVHSDGLICDTSGNILFYTNGCKVVNGLNNLMYNGDSLNPTSCSDYYCNLFGGMISDGNLIIPKPGSKSLYYLFHETCEYEVISDAIPHPSKLYYSVIDMEQQAGLGAVIEKNIVIINTTTTIGLNYGFLTAAKHANGRDWWIVVHGLHNNVFYSLLLTPDGLEGPFIQAYGPIGTDDGQGSTVFSPDGSKLATCTWWTHINTTSNLPEVHLFDFDRCTGQFSNHRADYYSPNYPGGGVSFSPNSRYLYFSINSHGLIQYDLSLPNFDSTSRTEIFHDTTIDIDASRLAYNQKIYILGPTSFNFSSINYPDSGGLACNFQLSAVPLPYDNVITIPNYPNYRLGALAGSSCDTLTGINDISAFQLRLRVHPNPSIDGNFHFQFNDTRERIKELEVTDVTGRVVNLIHNNINELDLSILSSGIYFYTIKTNNEKLFNGKLIRE